jgi:hypothetical protein
MRIGGDVYTVSMKRLAFRIANGRFPDNYKVYQTCNNRTCGNPAHLIAIDPVRYKDRRRDVEHGRLPSEMLTATTTT